MARDESSAEGGRCRANEAGFTLTEVIAALAILALSLGGLFGLLSDSLRRTGQADTTAQATSLAQSLLARVGTELPLQAGITAGDLADGYHWRLLIAPYGATADRRAWPLAAYTVSVEVTWGQGPPQDAVALTTLRLGPKGDAR